MLTESVQASKDTIWRFFNEFPRIRDILRRWACTLHWLWRRCCPAWAPAWSHRCMWRCTWPEGMRKSGTNNRHQIRLGLTDWLTDRVNVLAGTRRRLENSSAPVIFYSRQWAGDEQLDGCFCRCPNAVLARWQPKQCITVWLTYLSDGVNFTQESCLLVNKQLTFVKNFLFFQYFVSFCFACDVTAWWRQQQLMVSWFHGVERAYVSRKLDLWLKLNKLKNDSSFR